MQSSTISIPAVTLSQPHLLTVSLSRGELDGVIELNGRVLQQLQGMRTRVDLAPHLFRGRNTLQVWGNYHPHQASVRVELALNFHGISIKKNSSRNLIANTRINSSGILSLEQEELPSEMNSQKNQQGFGY